MVPFLHSSSVLKPQIAEGVMCEMRSLVAGDFLHCGVSVLLYFVKPQIDLLLHKDRNSKGS